MHNCALIHPHADDAWMVRESELMDSALLSTCFTTYYRCLSLVYTFLFTDETGLRGKVNCSKLPPLGIHRVSLYSQQVHMLDLANYSNKNLPKPQPGTHAGDSFLYHHHKLSSENLLPRGTLSQLEP